MINNDINVVIGSWGSYHECNERALGSSWITLNNYDDFDEILEELKGQGFELDGIDEELFIQDIEGINTRYEWNYCNPKTIFDRLKQSGVLDDEDKYQIMQAYLENDSFNDWLDLVEREGEHWDDDIYLRTECKDWETYGRTLIAENVDIEIPEQLEEYFDYAQYGEDQAKYDNIYLTEYGVLENFG